MEISMRIASVLKRLIESSMRCTCFSKKDTIKFITTEAKENKKKFPEKANLGFDKSIQKSENLQASVTSWTWSHCRAH